MTDDLPQHEKVRTATCLCGDFHLAVRGEPSFVNICSCLSCQRRSGSAFSYTAFFPDAQVVSIDGESKHWRRETHSGETHDSYFCPTCGVTLYARLGAAPGHIAATGGAFADPDFVAPSRFFWMESRHRWLTPIEGVSDHEKK
jgi:hypothetical protein